MAKGSFRLDLKRDDARTLMLKMDARLTYAGRERNAAYRADGKRELKHIDCSRQLIAADFNRAKRDVQRRLDYLQTLQEQNKERRLNRTIAWCEEEERDWELQAAAARRRRALPNIKILKNHKAEAVGSIRRDQKREFANKITHDMHLNRSMNSLSESFAKHKAISQRNAVLLATSSENLGIVGHKPSTGETLPSINPNENQGELNISRAKPMSIQTTCINLPGLGLPVFKAEKQKSSLSQMISSGEICKLPGIVENDAPDDLKLSLARTFYLNTSGKSPGMISQEVPNTLDRNRPRVSIVDPSSVASGLRTRSRGRFTIVDPATRTKKHWLPKESFGVQRQVPVRFYELKDNPFMKDGGVPENSRPSDLVHADKSDEMYVWLGFESEEEYEKFRRGELFLEYDEDDASDTSSNADVLPTERQREQSWLGKAGPTGPTSDFPGRVESKLGAPRILLASAGGDASGTKPVEKFAPAAKMVMIVRKFQTNATDSP